MAAFGEAGVDLEGDAGRVVKAAHTLIRLFNQASSSHTSDADLQGQKECSQGNSSHLDPLAASHAVKLVTKYGIMPDYRKGQEQLEDQQEQLIEDLEALVEEQGTLQETALLAGAAIVALIQVRILRRRRFDQFDAGGQSERRGNNR